MTTLAVVRKMIGSVIWLISRLILFLMTAPAIGRGAGVLAIRVAFGTVDINMSTGQRLIC